MEVSYNQFSGHLPSTMGLSLLNLEELYLGGNRITEVFPSSIINASKLTMLDMGLNSLTGTIPDFGNLRLLRRLLLGGNNLTGESWRFFSSLTNCQYLKYMEVSLNQLSGILPASIGNLSTSLQVLKAFGCSIEGAIPPEIGNLCSLVNLNFASNQLMGFIPGTIGKLTNLQGIYFVQNKHDGYIPVDFCQLTNLVDLVLSDNMLYGSIPTCLGELKSLRTLNLDSNKLESTLPLSFWNLNDLLILNLSSNRLRGSLPWGIQNLRAINRIDLSWNQFSGDIPSSIGGMQSLNISSHNRLEGEIPSGGRFANFSNQSFMQNYALCSESRQQFSPCGRTHKRSRSKKVVTLMKYILPPALSLILAMSLTLFIVRRRKQDRPVPQSEIPFRLEWRRISYRELQEATNAFSESNILGSGSFGSVYGGTLSDGLNVAVKVFNLQSPEARATKSFATESKVLSTIRHRNLVKIIGCCSNTEFKALVLEYMPNGSLEKWLYSHNYFLDMLKRLNIAIDVALALEYLHHGDTYPIVHSDLKPSNVLLDEDMVAHIGYFGIAKLFSKGESMAFTNTLATIGYMAPEYGTEGIVSTSGDVYSYRVMLLEMYTRKKPTYEMFDEQMSLKSWVSQSLNENRITEVVDTNLLGREDENLSRKEQCVYSTLALAIECLIDSTTERINMREVVARLQKIKAVFLAR
ncbi:probable LRR receptor-like serine/threonine-protein kinase At3g47570 [Olea europaea var. sylvestris]|uniref:probable LRR receptor-like serine/threonine-protein kinase At3g47570 n=1 Tax=Olea europaea var. sylvestris TaxID=158386 RepID=UPI000C1D7CED|nr:probable LRR receptor-like serine/threonine-protein kinase At3g47570 [Olea europaea var. sylvestris]